MVKEFNLSKEMIRDSENVDVLLKGSVKDFIKEIKVRLTNFYGETGGGWNEVIDKIAGEDLI